MDRDGHCRVVGSQVLLVLHPSSSKGSVMVHILARSKLPSLVVDVADSLFQLSPRPVFVFDPIGNPSKY